MIKFNIPRLLFFIMTLSLGVRVYAAETNKMAQEIENLRAEIEDLNGQLQTLRDEHRSQVASYAARKAELSVIIEKDASTLTQLGNKIKEAQESKSSIKDQAARLLPDFLAVVDQSKAYIHSSLPYSTPERLGGFDSLANQAKNGEIQIYKGLGRLWALLEDEFRLANEISLAKQVVKIDGKDVLADVAKVGSVMMFYRSPDQRYGYVRKDADGNWSFLIDDKEESKKMIAYLFESLKKQIRVGMFELPFVSKI